MICLAVLTDGRRDCIEPAISSTTRLQGPITRRIIFDDSADDSYAAWLDATFGGFEIVHAPIRRGYGGAMCSAWQRVGGLDVDWVWWQEDDFTIERDVPLLDLIEVLEQQPQLVQMALRRQAWNDEEVAAGGIVELRPWAFTDAVDGRHEWLEHRQFWTSNPSLFSRRVCEIGWPDMPLSEAGFSARILDPDPSLKAGFWGPRTDPPWCEHIGYQRVGTGY